MSVAGTVIASIGIIPLTSFGQSMRLGYSGPIGKFCSYFLIFAAISMLWRISRDISWWTIAVFIVASLISGTINAMLMRHPEMGQSAIVVAQTTTGPAFIICAVICWFL